MKVVIQHDIRDCGAACLKMIAAHYKLKLPFSKCRELTKTDKMGTNIYGLIDGAKKIGLSGMALYGFPEELIEDISKKKIDFPFVAHIISDNGLLHFVVITKYKHGKFIFADPAKGKQKLKKELFFERWTGNIVTFEKNEEFCPGNYTKGSFRKFFSLLKGQYSKLTGVLLLSLAISVIGILGAFVFQIVIDNFGFYTGEYQIEDEHEHEVGEACEECVTEESEIEPCEEENNPIEKILGHIAEVAESSDFSLNYSRHSRVSG